MAKVIGIEQRKGTLDNGTAYENYYIYTERKPKGEFQGVCADVQKVKPAVIRAFEVQNRVAGKGGLLGKDIQYYFDKYKNVVMIALNEG